VNERENRNEKKVIDRHDRFHVLYVANTYATIFRKSSQLEPIQVQ